MRCLRLDAVVLGKAAHWIRPELHRNTLKTTSGKNHPSGDVLPGTSCGCAILLAALAPPAAVEEDGVHTDSPFTTKDTDQSQERPLLQLLFLCAFPVYAF